MKQLKGKTSTDVNFKKKFEQAVFSCNPDLDYLEYNHLSFEKNRHGNFKKLTDSEKLNFDCCASFVYRHKLTGEIQKTYLYYITTNHQSISLTLIDLDEIVKCYGRDYPDIELIYAVSVVKPLLDDRLNRLVESGEVHLDKSNVRIEFVDFTFPITA